MTERRLDADERALWRRVTATVRAMRVPEMAGEAVPIATVAPTKPIKGRIPPTRPVDPLHRRADDAPGETLDGGWDRRLRRGVVAPDRSIDLHGHTLASAHAALDRALGEAVADGARLLLIVTGKPPKAEDDAPRRGAIRAGVGDWLMASPYASRIAAVRGAHPRHGGNGALYVILRRRR